MAACHGAKSQSEKALVMQRPKEMAEQGLLDESEKRKFRVYLAKQICLSELSTK